MYEKSYEHEKILHTRNCGRRFIKYVLPEKLKENMQTKQPLALEKTQLHRLVFITLALLYQDYLQPFS